MKRNWQRVGFYFRGLTPTALILAGLLWPVFNCQAVAQTTNDPIDAFGQAVLSYKSKMDDCLAGFFKKDISREERGAAAFSTSFLLESCEQFIKESNRQKDLISDIELMSKLCQLHVGYAEYQLEEAGVDSNPPSVTALEKAFKEYQLAYACLDALNDRNVMAKNGKRIEAGLARTINGLNKYADWFAGDVFMNTTGKKWEANPAPQAEKLMAEIAARTSSSGELAICERALEQVLKDMREATERKDGAGALDNMILGSRWLTTILQKSPEAFVNDFRKFNMVTRPAMEEAKKGYVPEKMQEFSRFYEPLKSHYIALTSPLQK